MFQTVGTEALAEQSFRAIRNVDFHRLPITVLVADFLAKVANGENALQQIDPFSQLACLAGRPADEVSKERKNADADNGIDDRVSDIPRKRPEKLKAKANQRLGNSQGISVIRTTEPSGDYYGKQERNGKDDVRPHKEFQDQAEDCKTNGSQGFLQRADIPGAVRVESVGSIHFNGYSLCY